MPDNVVSFNREPQEPDDPHVFDRTFGQEHRPPPRQRRDHLSQEEIQRCDICDVMGYRPNGVICDHQNHEHVGQAQRAHIRKMLAKGKP